MQDPQHADSDKARPDDFALFASLYPALRRFAAVVADADMDPDDLVQDALERTLDKHDLSELGLPAAYLKRAILHGVSNRRRRAGTFRRLLPRLLQDTVRVDSYPSDLSILDELKPLDRAVIFLLDVEGLGSTQAAEQLGLTPAATRKRASRARAQLRALLGVELAAVKPIRKDLS